MSACHHPHLPFSGVREFRSHSDPRVTKFVFESPDAVAEGVLTTRDDGSVAVCCSVQTGCPVGCRFCGTGKRFIRNLTAEEILAQVTYMIAAHGDAVEVGCDIFFLGMGEVMMNWEAVKRTISDLVSLLAHRPVRFRLSTVGVNDPLVMEDLIQTAATCPKDVGIQFSVHRGDEVSRRKLIPYHNLMSLEGIASAGRSYAERSGRKAYLSLVVSDRDLGRSEIERLMHLFSPTGFHFTFSPVYGLEARSKLSGLRAAKRLVSLFRAHGYEASVSCCPGYDDVGGGCGQLWYLQEWLQRHNAENLSSSTGTPKASN